MTSYMEFALEYRNLANACLKGHKEDLDTEYKELRLISLIPRNRPPKMGLARHPAYDDERIQSQVNSDDPNATITGGVIDALRQITENGEQFLDIDLILSIQKSTTRMLIHGGNSSLAPGALWLYGFRDACNYVINSANN